MSIFVIHRRRFEHAEQEYVQAKINLHKATELKELLSEHLCAVVQQNELRKATKLSQLTATLKLQSDFDKQGGREVSRKDCNMGMFQRTPTPRLDVWPHLKGRNVHGQSHRTPESFPKEVDTNEHDYAEGSEGGGGGERGVEEKGDGSGDVGESDDVTVGAITLD